MVDFPSPRFQMTAAMRSEMFPFSLIFDLLGDTSWYDMVMIRLGQHLEVYQRDLLKLAYFRLDEPLVQEQLKELLDGMFSPVSLFVANEIFMDLYISYHQEDCRFRGRFDLEKLVGLTYIKYARFVRGKAAQFYSELSKLRTEFSHKKWRIKKIKRVPQFSEPIKIGLDIRFATIKRANGKCEGCFSPISDNPIEVYQVRKEDKIPIKFVAIREKCKENYTGTILDES